MPLFSKNKSKRVSLVPPTVNRKSRTSHRVTMPEDEVDAKKEPATMNTTASVQSIGNTEVESETETEDEKTKHSETLPASDVTICNEYTMGPAFGCKFPIPYIRQMIESTINQKFKAKTYQPGDALKWVREVADDINLSMKGNCYQPRYKHVVQVIIYQQTGAGFLCGARAVWDQYSDDYISYTYEGSTFVCIATVYGCYQY